MAECWALTPVVVGSTPTSSSTLQGPAACGNPDGPTPEADALCTGQDRFAAAAGRVGEVPRALPTCPASWRQDALCTAVCGVRFVGGALSNAALV